MRKTLTALVVFLAAGSLAACKMPWDKTEPPPPPVAATATPTPETTASVDPAKPVEQTASVDPAKPATPEAAAAQPTSSATK